MSRKAATQHIVSFIERMIPGSDNTKIIEKFLNDMSDKEFAEYMDKLEKEEEILNIVVPIMKDKRLSVERNIKLGEELGHQWFQKIWMATNEGSTPYLTNQKYLILDLPIRRQAQLLEKKISIPEDNRSIDELTGQPTGKSKGSKISFPETQVLAALSLDAPIIELLKLRGGDVKAFEMMSAEIAKTGEVSQEPLLKQGTVVRSTETLSTYLTGMHLANTLLK